MCSSPGQRSDLKNIGLPQAPQKPLDPPSAATCQRSRARSSSMLTASAAKPAHVTNAAPWARRQRLQWQ